MMKGNKLRCW